MSGAIPPLPQYSFMAWCSVKAQGQLYFTLPYLYCFENSVRLQISNKSCIKFIEVNDHPKTLKFHNDPLFGYVESK
jgi:hypothetical protein